MWLTCRLHIADSHPSLNSGGSQHTFHTAIYLVLYLAVYLIHVQWDRLANLLVCGPEQRLSGQFEGNKRFSRPNLEIGREERREREKGRGRREERKREL